MELIDKSKIVAEIERRIQECDNLANAAADNNLSNTLQANELLIRQYKSLLYFLDTLEVKEVKEEPVSKDLEEAAEEYAPDFSNSIASKAAVDAVRDAFKSGAEWMAGQGETLYDTINVDGKNQRWLGENLLYGDYNAGQAVIVQIRKI